MKIKVGTILELKSNNYKITEKIAEGGNSSVWKAEVIGDQRICAIKILNNKIGTDKLGRFKRECQFCKDIDNKHIVKIFDYIAEEDKAYCVMPYYSRNLRSVIDEENDSFVLFDYIIQLCEALSFIHNHNDSIIHRDLKPENILVDDKNTLVLTDFGIAHFDDSTRTKRRDWLGNRRYAAPEQLATDDITTACDIYALGRIINELFTKQNPSGEDFLTIADVNPLLFPLDSIVQKCRIQNPELRPNINEILTELYLLEGEIKDTAEFIRISNYPIANTDYTADEEDQIITLSTHDIILAQYIFENLSDEKLEKLNLNYHYNILYDVDSSIQNLLFQTTVLDSCSHKFKNESNSYIDGGYYNSLNLNVPNDKALYDELSAILDNYKIPDIYDNITARIKKLFCSCCDYHCVELLRDIKELCRHESSVTKAPILYIVYTLRNNLEKEDLSEIVLSDYITINWECKPNVKIEEPDIYISLEQEELKILNILKEHYDVIYAKTDDQHFYVRFKTMNSFEKFKNHALELSHPYYVFEGDVEKVIRVRRKYYNIIELEPLDSFDITNTLAKILGLRNDY